MGNLIDTLLDFRDDFLDFYDDHKPLFIISVVLIVLLLVGGIVAYNIFAPVKIRIYSANEEVGDLLATKADSVTYYAIATRKGKQLDVDFSWSVDSGTVVEDNNGIVTWNLPHDEGTYAITATCEDAVSSKYVTVIGSDLANLYKNSDYKILLQDTDGDGLTDLYEASNSRTSSTEKDTDGDGLFDGDEIIMNFDPNVGDTKGDGLLDGERKLEYTFTSPDIILSMTGKGNFTRTSVDKYETETIENVSSVLDGIYSIYTDAKLDDAKVSIKYSKDKVKEKALNENTLAVYSLDDKNNSFTKIASEIDSNASTIVFTTSEFGKYFIADSSKLTSNLATELVFIIDNSGSMYSKDEYADSEENDPNFVRVDVVNNIVDRLKGNYKFGAGKFTFEYTELSKLTQDKETIKNRVSSIKTLSESFTGTYIGKGLEGGISLFSKDNNSNRKYLILLSDGVDSRNDGYDEQLVKKQIEVAKTNNIKVYTIGLGNSIDEKKLKEIAQETKGKYYFAPTADDLIETFNLITAELNYNSYDTNNDGVDDSIIIADSGFGVKRDGFSFSNFSNTQVSHGYSYGMILFSKLFYENKLPERLGAKKITTTDGNVVEAPAVSPSSITSDVTTLRTYRPKALSVLCEFPDDYWANSASGGKLPINSKYKGDLTALGFSTYFVPYSANKAGFSSYESLIFDMKPYLTTEEGAEFESPFGKDADLFRILSRLDITKYRDDKFYFYDNNDTAFERLTTTLKNGSPVMIRINDDYTVLAIKLLADTDNMNKYKIEVYDANYAGVKKYIEVDRNKYSEITEISKVITDKYEYKFKYQGTDVGICLSFPNVQENE